MEATMTAKVTVQANGRIELVVPDAREGEIVEVLVYRPEQAKYTIADIVEMAKPHRSFRTADEVDAYINELRDEWDR